MKILMLVNWKVDKTEKEPADKQPPDYYIRGRDYWFYRYFKNKPDVDLIDISSFGFLERIEKTRLRFYVWQAIKAIMRMSKYDLIVSHGMQSGIVVSLWRRLFKYHNKHIVFDIGSFASASEDGIALKLMQFASKSIDGVIYHTSSQKKYYERFFPWVGKKSKFIRFGTDLEFFYKPIDTKNTIDDYILCVGYNKRDWSTLVKAYHQVDTSVKLRLVGHVNPEYANIEGVEQIPYVSINELIKQIVGARFCVLPLADYNYSFGQMTLLQQMALHKCVLMANVRSLLDYAEDGKTAIFYKSRDVTDLAIKINDLLNNKEKVAIIGENAAKYLSEKCNEKIMATEIEKYLKSIFES